MKKNHQNVTTAPKIVDPGSKAVTGQNARDVNLVPLPYSRVAVQSVDFALNEAELKSFLQGKEAWFETDYVVFRRNRDCAVVELRKEKRASMFCRITEVGIVSLPDSSHWSEDPTVDTGNPSALAEKARALGIGDSETLVVSGLYEHVNFIHRPRPRVIDVFDLSPPDPPRRLTWRGGSLRIGTFRPSF
jgi:hypothetical protein